MAIRVALVDDEQVTHAYVKSMKLWREGEFDLAVTAFSGNDLLEKMEKTPVDIVLMDVFMPEMDGVSLSERLAQLHPRTDLVAISNFDGYDYVRPIMKNGARDYLLKTRMTEESLKDVLHRIMQQRATEGVGAAALREQLRRFLEGNGGWPFPTDGGHPVACFGVMDGLAGLPQDQAAQAAASVVRMMEEGAAEQVRRTAVYSGKGEFLLILRFYGHSSMAVMQREANYICAALSDSVGMVYKARLTMEVGPVLSNAAMLPPYVLERVQRCNQVMQAAQESLSLEDTHRLLALMAAGDVARLKAGVEEILTPLSQQDMRAWLFCARSAVELARSAALEWQLPAPPEGNALFAWMRAMEPPVLIGAIAQLFVDLVTNRRTLPSSGYSDTLRSAAAFIGEHYGESISLSAVASAVGVTESHLSRLFRKEMDMTMSDYLTHVRLEKAKELLRQGKPIKEVAALVGYVQYNHFLRVFKQREGCTIKQYLQKVKMG